MSLLIRLLTSRAGLLALAIGLGFGWHVQDRARAVEAALSAERQRAQELAQAATQTLFTTKTEDDARIARLEQELKDYETRTPVDPSCVISDGLVDLLRRHDPGLY